VTVNESSASEWLVIGDRIRTAREAIGMSVRELARRVEVSASHVSQVERGLAQFSVRTLYSVVSELGVSMDSLFDDTQAVAPAPGLTAPVSQPTDDDALVAGGIVLRSAGRPTIPLAGGTRWERLTPRPEAAAEFIEVVYPPAKPTELRSVTFAQHSSREYGVVISGSLTVQVGFERSVLHAGDSIAFDSMVPHRFWNETSEEVRCIWFIADSPHGDHGGNGVGPRPFSAHDHDQRMSGT
jgi:transcriptional regulator with XRE-family HTH domain/quercetin dioxygenase-like cupin family protein